MFPSSAHLHVIPWLSMPSFLWGETRNLGSQEQQAYLPAKWSFHSACFLGTALVDKGSLKSECKIDLGAPVLKWYCHAKENRYRSFLFGEFCTVIERRNWVERDNWNVFYTGSHLQYLCAHTTAQHLKYELFLLYMDFIFWSVWF